MLAHSQRLFLIFMGISSMLSQDEVYEILYFRFVFSIYFNFCLSFRLFLVNYATHTGWPFENEIGPLQKKNPRTRRFLSLGGNIFWHYRPLKIISIAEAATTPKMLNGLEGGIE